MKKVEPRQVHLTVRMVFEISDPNVMDTDVRDHVVRALRHSTAADAIQDAVFAKFEEAVMLEGWEVEL